jgi:phospholipase A-2-activating protein
MGTNGQLGFTSAATLAGHTHFATAVAWVPPGALSAFPSGAVVSGSRDKRVLLWDAPSATQAAELVGHEQQVCLSPVSFVGAVVQYLPRPAFSALWGKC